MRRLLVRPLLLAGALLPRPKRKPKCAAPMVLPSYKDLKFPPLPPIQRSVNRRRLRCPNGMKVYLLEDHELPLVSGIGADSHRQSCSIPPTNVAWRSMTGDVMRSGGTQSKTGDQIDRDLENIAASVESPSARLRERFRSRASRKIPMRCWASSRTC